MLRHFFSYVKKNFDPNHNVAQAKDLVQTKKKPKVIHTLFIVYMNKGFFCPFPFFI